MNQNHSQWQSNDTYELHKYGPLRPAREFSFWHITEAALVPLQKQLQSSRSIQQRTDVNSIDISGYRCSRVLTGAVCSAGQPKLLNTGKFFGKKLPVKSCQATSLFQETQQKYKSYHTNGGGPCQAGAGNVQRGPINAFCKASNVIPTSWTGHERLPSKEGDHIDPSFLTHAVPTTSENTTKPAKNTTMFMACSRFPSKNIPKHFPTRKHWHFGVVFVTIIRHWEPLVPCSITM